MRLAPLSFFVFVALVLASACSSSSAHPTIRASDYDMSCTAPADCALVDVGDVCGCMACGSDAISKRDSAKYEADKTVLQKQCSAGGTYASCPNACFDWELTCVAGKCGACSTPGCSGVRDGGTNDAAHD